MEQKDIIELAREMGRQIQKDERYIALHAANQNCDEDKDLQELIGEFNLKRMAINNEVSKEEKDENKISTLNEELRNLYDQVMHNHNMMSYQKAKEEMDTLLQRVNAIITLSAEGEDPETADAAASCGGDCASCGSCH